MSGEPQVKIELLEFYNPYGLTFDGKCCDDQNGGAIGCDQNPCDLMFQVCLTDPDAYRYRTWAIQVISLKLQRVLSSFSFQSNSFICPVQKQSWHGLMFKMMINIDLQYVIKVTLLYNSLSLSNINNISYSATTANDLRLRRISVPDLIHHIIFLS